MSTIKLDNPSIPDTILTCPFCKELATTFGHTGAISVYCSNDKCMEHPCITTYSFSAALSLWNKLAS